MQSPSFFNSIRARLLLIAVLLLLIPAIGFRFVQQMEQLLREGQRQVLVSAAKLLSVTLSDRPQLFVAQASDNEAEQAERRKLLALFGSADPQTAAQLGAAYLPSDEIEKILGVVAKNATRIWVVDSRSRVRGLAGNLNGGDTRKIPAGFFQQLYTTAVRPIVGLLAHEPGWTIPEDAAQATRAVMTQVDRALSGQPTSYPRFASDGLATVMSVAEPVWQGDNIVAAVVVEETTSGSQSITFAALESLLAMTLVVLLVGFGALLVFAWRLAFRVRILQREADTAIDPQGRIRGRISGSSSRDEIGALSLTLEGILLRLSHYNHYLEQMAARLSHELRTPLAVVRSSLDNLRATEVSEEGKVYIARADEGVQRLSSLISRMAEATRLESMLVGSEKESCDIARLIEGCVDGYRLAYPSAAFVFVPPNDPVVVDAIADAVAQMLDKLVQNAVDFALPGTPVTIALNASEKRVRIQVDNQGKLLAPDIASTLFSSLVSSRRDGVDNGSHLGLGLYIVRLIAEFHNGTVTAQNLPDGNGVRFEVLLAA
jgi:signal transduction histidine kinase